MTNLKPLLLCVLVLVSGCNSAHQLHQPGPIISLYQKDGGPTYQTGPGTYSPLIVENFFKSHPAFIDSFVNHGVCSQVTDPASDEATQNRVICQGATTVSMDRSFQRAIDANK